MTIEELKIRQMTNQYLIEKSDKMTVVRNLCGIQAQFMANAMHSLRLRCNDYHEETVADGLVKNWTVRGTVHVFAESDLPLFKHCGGGKDYRSHQYGGYCTLQRPDGSYHNEDDGNSKLVYALTPERQRYFSEKVVEAVRNGPQSRDDLKALCRSNGMTEIEETAFFDSWGGGIRDLCERGFMNYAVQEKKAYIAAPEFRPIPEEEAKLEMARRYFTNIAPATIHDAMYFFHAKQAEVKDWLRQLPAERLEWNGKTYYYIPNGKTYSREIPPCIFLAGFDQLMLGYQKRESLYLPQEYLRGIFNLAGIVMPPILLRGKVVGRWKKKNGALTLTLFEPLSGQDRKQIRDAAETTWGGLQKIEFEA